MTKKLKKRLNRIAIGAVASTLSIVAVCAIGARSFSVPKEQETAVYGEFSLENSFGQSYGVSDAVVRLENTATTTYIYDATDLAAFRDKANAGDTFANKTVYLMADIDLSTVCSSSKGSWTPINSFSGTFDGKYHKIKNLYINTTTQYTGLFVTNNGTIQNTILENVSITQTSSSRWVMYAGGICTLNNKNVKNCGVQSGTITSTLRYSTNDATAYNMAGGIVRI